MSYDSGSAAVYIIGFVLTVIFIWIPLYSTGSNISEIQNSYFEEKDNPQSNFNYESVKKGDIKIVSIKLNNLRNLNSESVTIQNQRSYGIHMKDFVLSDNMDKKFYFPDYTLEPYSKVIIYTGKGTNNKNTLYWNSNSPIWNNDQDSAYLYGPDNTFIDHIRYKDLNYNTGRSSGASYDQNSNWNDDYYGDSYVDDNMVFRPRF